MVMKFSKMFDHKGNLVLEELDSNFDVTKDDALEILNALGENAESQSEMDMADLLMSLIENDLISEDAYPAIFDFADSTISDEEDAMYDEVDESKMKKESDDMEDDEEVEETDDEDEEEVTEAIPLWKRNGMVKMKIGGRTVYRKRGHTQPIDKKKSRILKKAKAKSSAKRAAKLGAKKAKKTKKRMGQ